MILLFVFFGALIGFLGGLFGIGGGIIAGPLLLLSLGYLGVDESAIAQTAIITALAIIVCTSIVSATTHWRYQRFISSSFAILAMGVVVGSIVGSFTLMRLDGMTIKLLLGSFLLIIAYALGVSNRYFRFLKGILVKIPLAPVGFLTGYLSAILGVGGGLFNTPVLMGRGLDIRKAVGISASCSVLIGLGAVISSSVFSYFDDLPILYYIYLPAFIPIALTAGLFANLGARTAQKIPRQLLRRSFALFILLVGCSILIETWMNFYFY